MLQMAANYWIIHVRSYTCRVCLSRWNALEFVPVSWHVTVHSAVIPFSRALMSITLPLFTVVSG